MRASAVFGCPRTAARTLKAGGKRTPVFAFGTRSERTEEESKRAEESNSCLGQWPVQIKLVPVNAPYFDGAKLLITADCTAYAYAAFHERFIKGHITLVGCPQLDGVICVTDTVAFGALQVLRDAGRRVGEDVGLAGIGDNWAGKVVEPGLTTIRFYQRQVGQEAARMLLQSLEHTGPDAAPVRQTTLGYTLVERGSL